MGIAPVPQLVAVNIYDLTASLRQAALKRLGRLQSTIGSRLLREPPSPEPNMSSATNKAVHENEFTHGPPDCFDGLFPKQLCIRTIEHRHMRRVGTSCHETP